MIDAQMRDQQGLQAQIAAVRHRHATLLKELRADQQAAKQIERLRKGEGSPRRGRDRGKDRER
ncbi:MAG: hypothetical protein ABL907_14855 [Hyphomicrobium sp.]